MNCFENLISIRGLCETDNAKAYLDDYGISLLTASAVADERYISGKKLIESKIKQAWRSVVKDITFKGLQANKILQTTSYTVDETIALDEFTGFRGIDLYLDNSCELYAFYIGKIKLSVSKGGQTSIKIIADGIETIIYDGTISDDTTITISVNDYVFSNNLQIVADNTNVKVNSGKLINDCCSRNYIINNNSENYGITADVQVRCDKTMYLCQYSDLLVDAVVYKALALIWDEVNESNRLNNLLLLKKDDAIMKMAFYDSTFNLMKYDPSIENNYTPKGLYQKELENINIPIPKCRCCMECKSDSYVISLT